MRARHLIMTSMLGVAAAAGAVESWHVWTPAGTPVVQPTSAPVLTRAGMAGAAPTATDEGEFPPPGAVRSPRTLSDAQRRRNTRAALTPSSVPPPLPAQPPQGSSVAPPVPVERVDEPSRNTSDTSPLARATPPPGPTSDSRAGQAAPSPTAPTSALPAAMSGSAGAQGTAQDAGGSHEATSGGGRGASPPADPPRLTPPRLIDTVGTVYPGDAFHLTLRRQDLGSELAVEGAEGTVSLRALISADGSVRSVDVTTSSGSPVLDRAAAEAARLWRFSPATQDGVPIEAFAILRIRYVVR